MKAIKLNGEQYGYSVKEDDSNWYIDMRTGLGEAIYPKEAFTLEEAISDQKNWRIE